MTFQPESADVPDFDELEAAVRETERGRWFLAEFERRQRARDTSRILAAIERLEARAALADEAEARARQEADRAALLMRELADALKQTRGHEAKPRNIPPASIPASVREAISGDARSLEQRLAGLVHLDSLDVEAKLKLFG